METISHCMSQVVSIQHCMPHHFGKKMWRTEKAYLTFSSVNSWAFTAEVILWYAVLASSRLQPALMQAAAAAV